MAATSPKKHLFSSQVAMNILNSGRFSMGSASAGMIKKLIGASVKYFYFKFLLKACLQCCNAEVFAVHIVESCCFWIFLK